MKKSSAKYSVHSQTMAKLHEEESIRLIASPSMLQNNLTYDDEYKKFYYVHKNNVELAASSAFMTSNEESIHRVESIESEAPFSIKSCNFAQKATNVLAITARNGVQVCNSIILRTYFKTT